MRKPRNKKKSKETKWMDDSYLSCLFSFVGEVSMCFTLIFPLFKKKIVCFFVYVQSLLILWIRFILFLDGFVHCLAAVIIFEF